MFIRADIAMITQTKESGFGKQFEPQSDPPARDNHHSTMAPKIRVAAMIFCTMYSAFSERENVAMKVNSTADKPQSASAKCSMNTGSTPAMECPTV